MRTFFALTATLAALALPAAAEAAGPIVFSSDRDGDHELYTIRPDGTSLKRLTRNRANDYTPVWSPDGRRIAFVSDRDGGEDIYVMRPDGTGLRRVTRNGVTPGGFPVSDLLPAWSPSGRRLAYASNLREGQFDIYTIRPDGTDRRKLTFARRAADIGPSWSPDGTRIAFASNRPGEGNLEIYTMRPDGHDIRRVTRTGGDFEFPEDDNLPAWSPDGSRIAFASNRHGSEDLYVIDSDGGNETRLTTTPEVDEAEPAWSPSGSRLVFTAHSFDEPFFVEWLRPSDGERQRVARGVSPDWRWAAG